MHELLIGRSALVTGAQQGIGAATVIALAAAGADVCINYLDDEAAAQDLADLVRAAGRVASVIQGDVGTPAAAAALVEAAINEHGRIDTLVNNAGVFPRVPFLEMTEADYDFVMDVNMKGTFFCSQAAARAMVDAGHHGVIINLASQAIRGSSPRGVHYAASKGGIVSMTRAMALELLPHRIRVNAVAPGLTDTAQPRYGSSESELATMAGATPIGRMGTPAEIADVIVFLASDKSGFMVGQTVHANGGTYMPS